MKYLALINKNSGQTNPVILKETLSNYAKLHSMNLKILEISSLKEIDHYLPEEINKKIDTVISAGGDGTLNRIINHLAYCQIPLGIVPNGTANILAQSLDIPMDIVKALDVIRTGNIKTIDLGKVNETYFSVTSGCGLDATMIKNTHRELKKKYGIFAYVINIFNALQYQRKASYKLIIDGKKVRKRGINIIFINTGNILGDLISFKPGYSHHDDFIDICIYSPDNYADYIPILLDLISGDKEKARAQKAYHYKGKEIYFQCSPSMPIHIDGDIAATPPVTVKSCPKALKVVVPEKEYNQGPVLQEFFRQIIEQQHKTIKELLDYY
jgi:YegS/Rv2252/BmrU family lipid kinase